MPDYWMSDAEPDKFFFDQDLIGLAYEVQRKTSKVPERVIWAPVSHCTERYHIKPETPIIDPPTED